MCCTFFNTILGYFISFRQTLTLPPKKNLFTHLHLFGAEFSTGVRVLGSPSFRSQCRRPCLPSVSTLYLFPPPFPWLLGSLSLSLRSSRGLGRARAGCRLAVKVRLAMLYINIVIKSEQGTSKHSLVCDECLGLDDFKLLLQVKPKSPRLPLRLSRLRLRPTLYALRPMPTPTPTPYAYA